MEPQSDPFGGGPYPVRGQHTVLYQSPPSRVYEVLLRGFTDARYVPPDRAYTLEAGDGRSVGSEIHMLIAGNESRFRLVRLVPDAEILLDVFEGPLRGPYRYALCPYGGGTLLAIDFAFEFYGEQYRTLARMNNFSLLSSLAAFNVLQHVDKVLETEG